jgi:FkbM family methyltransferase
MNIKPFIQTLAASCGYQIVRSPAHRHGRNPFCDMRRFLSADDSVTVFDIGANIGQSVQAFRRYLPNSRIHSFEPSPQNFRQLQQAVSGHDGITAWNYALGSQSGKVVLLENSRPTMSSLLQLGEAGWGQVEKHTDVAIRTIDDVCSEQGVAHIDILKSDTQGYDLEVFKGAERMISENRVGIIFCELIFADIYQGMPPFDAVYRHLVDRGFALVCFYDMHFNDLGHALYCDGLFVNRTLHCSRLAGGPLG